MRWVAALLLSIGLASGCGLIHPGGQYAVRGIIYQRGEFDCGVAAFAMAMRMWYDDAAAVLPVSKLASHGGLSPEDLVAASKTIGRPLVVRTEFNPRSDHGILLIRWPNSTYHFIFIAYGWAYDPAGDVAQKWAMWAHDKTFEARLLLTRLDY